ncbi:MAG: hypothetical protein J6386_21640 [Candidatus Synoicihabitans palmerolidicus]|nr:hypothetical protein [Candidatus Synoicihabitans palmerolidicus]
MLVADSLFAARPFLPPGFGRIAPTLLVPIGQAALLIGARVNANHPIPKQTTIAIVLFHAFALTAFYLLDPSSSWRRVVNGVVWASLAYFSYRALRESHPVFWRSTTAPAKVFAAHAGFHVFRTIFALLPITKDSGSMGTAVDIMGDLEVSFFMVALFVGLLISHRQHRNEQLSSALAEVKNALRTPSHLCMV